MVEEKLIDGSTYLIELDTQEMVNHFTNPVNCTKEILHQFNNLSWYTRYLSQDDKIILDLGGNVGLFALHVTPWADKIITVEPTPEHMDLNKHITGKFKNVIHYQAAISNNSGVIPFYKQNENTTMHSIIPRNGGVFNVKSITIPELIEEFNLSHIDFMKMDIEGSEVIALNEDIIEYMSKKIRKILIEFHEVGGVEPFDNRSNFEKLFIKFGYNIEHFGHDGLFCIKN